MVNSPSYAPTSYTTLPETFMFWTKSSSGLAGRRRNPSPPRRFKPADTPHRAVYVTLSVMGRNRSTKDRTLGDIADALTECWPRKTEPVVRIGRNSKPRQSCLASPDADSQSIKDEAGNSLSVG